MTLTQFKKEAAQLPPRHRAALAASLLHSLPDDDYDVSDEEARRRAEELRQHPDQSVSLTQFKKAVLAGRAR